MSKKLIIVNGTMGAGKTAVCRKLNNKLDNSVWLDGDWCWMMNPFTVNEENKRMVIQNIIFLLRNFLINSSFEYVLFDWVIPEEYIFDMILEKLNDLDFEVIKITLVCSENALKERINKDMKLGLRDKDCFRRSCERIPGYKNMNTVKIDNSDISVSETAEKIMEVIACTRL